MRERARSERKRMERSTHSTHYEVLGVQSTADAAQIRAAYVRMLKRHHPDSASRDLGSAGSNVQRLVLAYTVLKDQTKRAAYDHELKHSMETVRKARVPALAVGKSRRNELRPLSRKAAATLYLTVAGILAAGSLLYLIHDRSRSRVTPSPKNSVTCTWITSRLRSPWSILRAWLHGFPCPMPPRQPHVFPRCASILGQLGR